MAIEQCATCYGTGESVGDQGPVVCPDCFGDGLICFGLLLLRRSAAAFHEEELGAEEPDAFATEVGNLLRILQSADVRDDFYLFAVAGDRRIVGVGEVFLAPAVRPLLRPMDPRDLFRRRPQTQRAFVAIENNARAVRNLERPGVYSGQSGNA